MPPNWGNVGAVVGGVAGGALGGPVGAATGAGLGGAAGSWLGGSNPASWATGLAGHIGQPGHSNFRGTAFQNNPNSGYDPTAFQGGWNDANNPFSTGHMAAGAANAANAQAPGFAQAQAGQSGLAQLLMNQATGQGPSLAQAQLQQAQQTNAANTMAMEAQQRGMNPSLAGYQAGQINAQGNQQAAQGAVQAGIQERLGAMGQLGGVLHEMGQMGLNQQQQNNQLVEYFTSQGMTQEQAQLQAQIAQQQILAGSYNQNQALNAGVSMANAQNSAQLIGGILGAGSAAGGQIGAAIATPAAAAAASQGGVVPGYTEGGTVRPEHGLIGVLIPGLAGGGPAPVAPIPNMTLPAMAGPTQGPAAMMGGAGVPLSQLQAPPPGLSQALQTGGRMPGMDPGHDTTAVALRPGEVVVNQESAAYPIAKRIIEQEQAAKKSRAMRILQSAKDVWKDWDWQILNPQPQDANGQPCVNDGGAAVCSAQPSGVGG